MKVALVINSLSIGGAEKYALMLSAAWQKAGHNVTILTFTRSNDAEADIPSGVKRISLDASGKNRSLLQRIPIVLTLLTRLRREIGEFTPDVVVAFMDQANIFTSIALRGTKTPLIVAERSNPSRTSIFEGTQSKILRRLIAELRNWAYQRANLIVVQTERAKIQFPNGLQNKIFAIPNFVRAPTSSFKRTPANCPQVVSIGRLAEAKRFDLLISAFSAVLPRYTDATLTIFGEGSCRAALESQIKDLNLQGSVKLAGLLADPEYALKSATVFVLTSEFEGFPNALCEAAVHGVPCIAFDCDYGPREILAAGERGILVSAGDTKALSKAIDKLLGDPALQDKLAKAGASLSSVFSEENVLNRWNETIASLSSKDR